MVMNEIVAHDHFASNRSPPVVFWTSLEGNHFWWEYHDSRATLLSSGRNPVMFATSPVFGGIWNAGLKRSRMVLTGVSTTKVTEGQAPSTCSTWQERLSNTRPNQSLEQNPSRIPTNTTLANGETDLFLRTSRGSFQNTAHP